MRSAGSSESAACGARPGAVGVVSRPGLWERLERSARVTVVSAPPGSGKTVLLRSWIDEAGLAGRTAWVPVGRDERDPQRFWLSVVGALRQTSAGSALVRELTAAPEIADELSASASTVKTHLRNLYAKLGAHSRAEAVRSARALGLLAPSTPQR